MGVTTGIEWTDATWNPVTGCTRVSAGCDHCYAERLARRLLRAHYTSRAPVVASPENVADPFAVRLWPERLSEPLEERRPLPLLPGLLQPPRARAEVLARHAPADRFQLGLDLRV